MQIDKTNVVFLEDVWRAQADAEEAAEIKGLTTNVVFLSIFITPDEVGSGTLKVGVVDENGEQVLWWRVGLGPPIPPHAIDVLYAAVSKKKVVTSKTGLLRYGKPPADMSAIEQAQKLRKDYYALNGF